MKPLKFTFLVLSLCLVWACRPQKNESRPNIVLIMADDMGNECLSINGATEYKTPNIDRLSKSGMRFTNMFSQPLCTPSRVKIMTGKYNFRNYEHFGYLNPNQKTFGNLMRDAGYKTCIAGKWQLNGLTYQLPGYQDTGRPSHFGFDEHCLWQLNHPRSEGERFANPLITQNGKDLERDEDAYGPDIFSDFVCQFIDKHASEPFFIYYPMVLVHDPFVPTPDSPEWADAENRYKGSTKFYKDMVDYTDKIVGKIEQKLIEHGLAENTVLIFTADNGTRSNVVTQTVNGPYRGGKSYTTQRGIHVPFMINWPGHIAKTGDFDGNVDFSDIYPTLAGIAGIDISGEAIDGTSFLNVLHGDFSEKTEATMIHYDPLWGATSQRRNRLALTGRYKLYRDGKFYDHVADIDEQHPIIDATPSQERTKLQLQQLLDYGESESPWDENKVETLDKK